MQLNYLRLLILKPAIKKLGICLIGLSLFCLPGCQAQKFADVTGTITSESLVVPEAEYRSVAWLDEDHIAFAYQQEEFGDRQADRRIGLLTRSTGEWRDIPLPQLPDGCFPTPSGVVNLNHLPDGNLGFVQHCHGNSNSGDLYIWDKETDSLQLRQAYGPRFLVRDYTFSPDMSEIIQEDAIGAGLNDELYRVNSDGQYKRILSHFERARGPGWSPDGEIIAFSGTEAYPERTNNPMTWAQIESNLLYPWDIYLMDADGGNIRILLPNAGRPYQLKWSPVNDTLLAYAGDSQDTKGIWLLNVDTLELTRIWGQNTFYDWSPDGQKMVIIAESNDGNTKRTYPVIVDIIE
jgi:hypothetical protein